MKLKLILLCLLAVIQARFVKSIIGGRDADSGTFPNVVAIYGYIIDPDESEIFCGGTVYTATWILLTGKCTSKINRKYPREHVKVYAGRPNLKLNATYEQMRMVVQFYTHPDFSPSQVTTSIDLGLLELNEPLLFNEHVDAFPLSSSELYPAGYAVVVGWGVSNVFQIYIGIPSDNLKVLDVHVLSKVECKIALLLVSRWNRAEFSPDSFNNYICTGSFRSPDGPSVADNGGPIMQKNQRGTYDVIGLISTGPSPPECVGPTLYLRTAPFISWIQLKTEG